MSWTLIFIVNVPARGRVYDTLEYKNNGWKITFQIQVNKWSTGDEVLSIFELPHPSNSSLSVPSATLTKDGNFYIFLTFKLLTVSVPPYGISFVVNDAFIFNFRRFPPFSETLTQMFGRKILKKTIHVWSRIGNLKIYAYIQFSLNTMAPKELMRIFSK